jgi:hypothetical protein
MRIIETRIIANIKKIITAAIEENKIDLIYLLLVESVLGAMPGIKRMSSMSFFEISQFVSPLQIAESKLL